MTEAILTHDAGVSAFEDAGGVVETADGEDEEVSFSWDEDNIVRVDAPANLEGAFDTDRFYKIEGATVARPIKQPYLVGDEIKWYKKPADELDRAAWSFDNAPFTLGHPDTGMVKNVDDIRGFWRNPRYNSDAERLKEDLYVPVGDDEAMEYIEEHGDVSVGFYNRVHSNYDGNTGDLTDDDNLDGFQVDMFGNHIAGVERGRCSDEHGCGLDDADHGEVVAADGGPTHKTMTESTTDAPSGIYVADDGTWLAVAPSEHSKDSTEHPDDAMFPVDSCSDVEDAWGLRGHTSNLDISKETLGNRIERVDESKDCGVIPDESEDAALDLDEVEGYHPWKVSDTEDDCPCDNRDSDMANPDGDTDDGFDIPDLSVDAIVEQNDAVREIKEERDSLHEDLNEMRTEIEDALDTAENFSIETDEDEHVYEAVDTLVADLDQKVQEVEDLTEKLSEYREDEIDEKLDRLEDLGADRDDWSETADEADDPIEALDEEIERREEVLDAAPETSVKDIDSSTDSGESDDEKTMSGTRTFPRGHGA